jgi:hypothetical protein
MYLIISKSAVIETNIAVPNRVRYKDKVDNLSHLILVPHLTEKRDRFLGKIYLFRDKISLKRAK